MARKNSLPYDGKIILPHTIAAAKAHAGLVSDEELSADYILPKAFDSRVRDAVTKAAAEVAKESGVARV